MLFQLGKPIQSIDDAVRGRGDVTDSFGRVLFKETPWGWLFVGEHRPVSDVLTVGVGS